MAKQATSGKRIQIDKANASIVAVLATASFIVVFSIIACRSLLGQRAYQGRVIKDKKTALEQLKSNNKAASELVTSYKTFIAGPTNILGGNPTGSGDMDGDNARIVLDALPSKYDFPALVASVEKIFSDKKYKIISISGIDDEINQSKPTKGAVSPVQMPFEVSISGNYDTIQAVIDILQRSIRPITYSKIDLSGNDSNLTIIVTAKAYYQPEKTVQITTKVVK